MPGARLGVDVGAVRIGVARCDAEQLMSVPVETVPAGPTALSRVADLTVQSAIDVVYVGLPLSLAGQHTASTQAAVAFATELQRLLAPRMVRLVDERLTSRTAHDRLRAAGRTTKSSRSIVDQAAAMVILDQALAVEKSTGDLAGVAVGEQA